MSKVYENRPNIVEVTVKDESGEAVRHIVGYSLDEVIEAVTLSLDGAEPRVAVEHKKPRKPRRTKAEIAAAAPEGKSAPANEADGAEKPKVPAWA